MKKLGLFIVAVGVLFSVNSWAGLEVVKVKKGKAIIKFDADSTLSRGDTYKITTGGFFSKKSTVVKVRKVTGSRALVKIISGDDLVKGSTYKGSEYDSSSSDDSRDTGNSIRDIRKIVGGSFSFEDQTAKRGSSEVSYSRLSLTGFYGHQKVKNTMAILVNATQFDFGGTKSGYLLGGVYYDHNFVDDVPENKVIFAVRGVGSGAFSLDDSDDDFGIYLSPRFVTKWYGLSPNIALVGDVGYDYYKWFGSDPSSTITGISLGVGVIALY